MIKILLLMTCIALNGCAAYYVEYRVDQLDEEGNVTSTQTAKARAIVANSSDAVSFKLVTEGDKKDIEFGKTNTGGAAQVEALRVVASQVACLANPLTCSSQ